MVNTIFKSYANHKKKLLFLSVTDKGFTRSLGKLKFIVFIYLFFFVPYKNRKRDEINRKIRGTF